MPGSSSRSAASAIRQPARYAIGGSPTSSVKRRASAARETPASRGELRDRPRVRRVVVDQPQRVADDRVGVRPGTSRARPPRRARATRAARRSAAGRAAGRAPPPGRARRARSRRPAARSAGSRARRRGDHGERRQRAQQPPADLAVELVGAGRAARSRRRARCPTCARRGGASRPRGPRGHAALARQDEHLRLGRRVVGDGVGVRARAAGRRRRARAGPARRRPGTTTAPPRTTARNVSGASSAIRIDHGGGERRAQQERPARPGPVEHAGDRIHGRRRSHMNPLVSTMDRLTDPAFNACP